MEPSLKLMIDGLRSGKSEGAAFQDYCWSKCVIPIDRRDLDIYDVANCPFRYPLATMEALKDAVGKGVSDSEIEAEFHKWLEYDRTVFRAADKNGRPTPADLIRAMSPDDQMEAVKLVGIRNVAVAIAGR